MNWRNKIWKDIPVIKCIPYPFDNHMGYRFWCQYCKTWHYHGMHEGHRVAHCGFTDYGFDNPLRDRGYYVVHYTKTELREIVKDIQRY